MPCELNIPGITAPLRLQLHAGPERVSEHIRQQHIWEPYETTLMVRHLQPGDVFLDIGANIGYYSVIAATLVGAHGTVIAYEPEAQNYKLLLANIALNHLTNVQPFMAALGDHNGKGHMYLCEDNKGDHQLYDDGSGRTESAVTIIHGDTHVSSLTKRVDFIKIDTQGSEVHILRGLQEVICSNREHLSMVIEFWPYGLRQAQTSGTELLEIIAGYDLPLFIIDHLAHRLIPACVTDLQPWVNNTDADPENHGFLNLFLSAHTQ